MLIPMSLFLSDLLFAAGSAYDRVSALTVLHCDCLKQTKLIFTRFLDIGNASRPFGAAIIRSVRLRARVDVSQLKIRYEGVRRLVLTPLQ